MIHNLLHMRIPDCNLLDLHQSILMSRRRTCLCGSSGHGELPRYNNLSEYSLLSDPIYSQVNNRAHLRVMSSWYFYSHHHLLQILVARQWHHYLH